jgi:hypothetical protein
MKDPVLFLLSAGLAVGWLSTLFSGNGSTACRVVAVVSFAVAAVFASGVLA